ncbi:MAG TPA: hypothetical protein HPP83_04275 [Candidatus Hydrogenedentes bacterium]|nr:hypothetical protein [Candidatus Hydrogenedentota bacterium]
MSGRDNYARAIGFKTPAYLPILIGCEFSAFYEQDQAKFERIRQLQSRIPDDVRMLGPSPKPVVEPSTEGGVTRWVDHWGTGWENDGHGAKTEMYPLEAGYHLIANHAFPDPYAEGLFAAAEETLAQRKGRYMLGSVWFTLFERLWMLRGFNNMLVDPYVETENWAALRDRVLEYNLAMIDQWIERNADGVYFSDDWGSQQGLLMEPDDWRTYYKPSYEAMFQRVRDGGAHVWMHLCGNVTAIIPDLIDIGLNVLNPVQPQAMDVRALSREFGGKVCFFGGADVQGTLIYGTPDDVKREADELVELFGCFNGGYIASTSHSIMPETPLDNVIALYEAFLAHN